MVPGRNDPCICGSGLKYKECCLDRAEKPRNVTISIDMGRPVIVTGYGFRPLGGPRKPNELRPALATVQRSYDRPKGPKVLSLVHLSQDDPLALDPNGALLQFDVTIAIDCNTRQINGQAVSVAVVVQAKWLEGDPLGKPHIQAAGELQFRDAKSPELLALRHVLEGLEASGMAAAGGRFGVVIDSHLGDLRKIESREAPILDDYFLPSWATLIFASDAANDRVPNALIRASDKRASDLLDRIEASGGSAIVLAPPVRPDA